MSRYDDIETHSGTVRWVSKREEPSSPFWPAALWPMLGILALSVFSCAHIQETTEAATERALTAANMEWAEANASGRTIYLSGNAPSKNEAERAARIAKNVDAGTWLGTKLVPAPVRVHESFEFPEAAPAEPQPQNETVDNPSNPRPPAPQPANLPSPDWNFRLNNGVLELNGEVPTDQIRQDINQLAQSTVQPPRFREVRDNLTVAGSRPPRGYLDVAKRGVRVVTECEQGVTSFVNKRFSVNCQLPQNKVQQVRNMAVAPLPFGTLGPVETPSIESVNACEASMRDLLRNARIEFASNSADIDTSSAQLVTSIANAAKACPGRLRIEGHTDSTGGDAKNQQLSQARAESVRAALAEKGVAASRLVARGFGSAKPIADNSTREGRARNRRIEIKVVGPND